MIPRYPYYLYEPGYEVNSLGQTMPGPVSLLSRGINVVDRKITFLPDLRSFFITQGIPRPDSTVHKNLEPFQWESSLHPDSQEDKNQAIESDYIHSCYANGVFPNEQVIKSLKNARSLDSNKLAVVQSFVRLNREYFDPRRLNRPLELTPLESFDLSYVLLSLLDELRMESIPINSDLFTTLVRERFESHHSDIAGSITKSHYSVLASPIANVPDRIYLGYSLSWLISVPTVIITQNGLVLEPPTPRRPYVDSVTSYSYRNSSA